MEFPAFSVCFDLKKGPEFPRILCASGGLESRFYQIWQNREGIKADIAKRHLILISGISGSRPVTRNFFT